MSVALLIEYDDGRDTELVPISNEGDFTTIWQHVAKVLDLVWVPQFQAGLPIRKEDIPEIIEELTKLENFLLNQREQVRKIMRDIIRDYMVLSIKYLVQALERLRDDVAASGYIT
jgi:hypothetical protein